MTARKPGASRATDAHGLAGRVDQEPVRRPRRWQGARSAARTGTSGRPEAKVSAALRGALARCCTRAFAYVRVALSD